ncbi:hydroxyacid oxidase 1 [Caerostris extrusa]|uniref:Hydroxyacid oxidase 1 n=1 Tax=Caerostris extrusa TaxID=172846 RepID=A0AAV4N1U1_CAEEX|nr:hydroxyacid oxidase 1 [Caerostris extrusa]
MSTLRDYEEYAVAYMDRHARDYYGSGAEDELTLRDNEKLFKSTYRLRPRLLRNVAVRNMSLTMLGQPVGMPLGISPIAFQKMAHPDGEIATARGEFTSKYNCDSTLFSLSFRGWCDDPEHAVHHRPGGPAPQDPSRQRALAAGVHRQGPRADQEPGAEGGRGRLQGHRGHGRLPVNGMWGVNMVHNLTLPSHLRLPNLQGKDQMEVSGSSLRSKVGFSLLDPTLTWEDIQWIQRFTALPIVVKGVLTAEDAILAVEHGDIGNIGVQPRWKAARDGVPATLNVLPEIVRAVKGRAEVYLDGGVRKGETSSRRWPSVLGPSSSEGPPFGASCTAARMAWKIF